MRTQNKTPMTQFDRDELEIRRSRTFLCAALSLLCVFHQRFQNIVMNYKFRKPSMGLWVLPFTFRWLLIDNEFFALLFADARLRLLWIPLPRLAGFLHQAIVSGNEDSERSCWFASHTFRKIHGEASWRNLICVILTVELLILSRNSIAHKDLTRHLNVIMDRMK